jgi:hypothetical protein
MAERLETLPAMQVARVWFPVPARPTFSVEKVALFCNSGNRGKNDEWRKKVTKIRSKWSQTTCLSYFWAFLTRCGRKI